MGFITTPKSKSTENSGMGLLLVFFSDHNSAAADTTTTTTTIPLSHSSSPPPPSSSSPNCKISSSSKTIRRTNSNNSPILTRTQSTLSICVVSLFLTLLLFTHSTFEPTTNTIQTPRRFLSQHPPKILKPTTKTPHYFSWVTTMWNSSTNDTKGRRENLIPSPFALQGMGKLYRRGTRAMSDLVVGHVVEDSNEDEFRLFFRLLHRLGLVTIDDITFVFASSSFAARFESLIGEENNSFLKLVSHYKESNFTSRDSVASFDVTHFVKNVKNEMGEAFVG